jgi:protein tyrosine/serine phosphatase
MDRQRTGWLDLDGAVNARDVGGMTVRHGRTIRPGRLYRSDNLSDLSPADIAELTGPFGLRDVVDLRTDVERRNEGLVALSGVPGVRLHALSLLPELGRRTDAGQVPPEAREPAAAADSAPGAPAGSPPELLPWQQVDSARRHRSAISTYRSYLDERPENIVAALQVIAHSDGATLVHCAAGKDRTGVVVALALLEVGADRAEVVADYVRSGERIERVLARLMSSPGYARDLDPTQPDRHRPQPETMIALLDSLDENDGGPGAWLRAHGWSSADADRLRTRLIA